MTLSMFRHATLAVVLFLGTKLPAQVPFQFPTANHALYKPGQESDFFAPTTPGRSWTSGSFGCIRNDGQRMHEGLDILHLHTDRHGEPTDPVRAAAAGTVMYINARAGLSNYGEYIVIRHVVEGIEVYSLYAHLSAVRTGLKTGESVHVGEVIATMGRTSNAGTIAKWRAHVHFELDLLVNDNFAAWFKKNFPGERNDHGEWSGLNLTGLDPREILLGEKPGAKKFHLLDFIQSQTALCRVLVRAKDFPYLKRYPMLVLHNPVAEKEGVAGYEIALNYNGVAFALWPRAESEIKSKARVQLLSVNAAEARANPCRHLVVEHGSHWQLTDRGLRVIDLLTY